MAERKKYPTIQSPTGTFKWPKLTSVDYGTKDFPNPDGSYNVRLVFDNATAADLVEELSEFYDEAVVLAEAEFAKLKIETRKKLQKSNGKTGIAMNDLSTELYDKDTEEPTGETEFRFKMKASGTRKDGSKWHRVPGIFDAKGAKFPRGIDIWGGTTGKVAFKPNPYFIPGTGMAGLSLSLEAVQVISLVSAGSRSASDYGFGEEEGVDGSTLEVPNVDGQLESSDAANAVAADADGHDF